MLFFERKAFLFQLAQAKAEFLERDAKLSHRTHASQRPPHVPLLSSYKYPTLILADRAGQYLEITEFPPDEFGRETAPKLYWDAPADASPFANPALVKSQPAKRAKPDGYCENCRVCGRNNIIISSSSHFVASIITSS